METYVSIPVPTEQFLELADFLREQGSDRDPVIAVRDAIEYWISNASWKQEALMPEILAEKNKGYTWKHGDSHLFLPHGTDIRMKYKDEMHYAKVVGDDIIYEGKPYSPANLANTITNSSRNAWRDLWIKKPGAANWVLANNARATKFIIEGKEVEI